MSNSKRWEMLENIYLTKFKNITRFIEKNFGHKEYTEDIFHEAIIRALNSESFEKADNPLYYILTVCANICRDIHKYANTRKKYSRAIKNIYYSQDDDNLLEKQLAGIRSIERFINSLNRLSPRAKEVFILHKIEGKSHREIREELGMKQPAIEKNMLRARAQLKELGFDYND